VIFAKLVKIYGKETFRSHIPVASKGQPMMTEDTSCQTDLIDKELLYYKSTAKDLKKKLRELIVINNRIAQSAVDGGLHLQTENLKIGVVA